MEQDSTNYSYLRSNFFEKQIPPMIYCGSEKERRHFFYQLRDNGRDFIYFLFNMIYADKIPSYSYEKNNFMLDVIHKDDVFMIQILLPAYNPNTDDILRTYLIFDKHNDDIAAKKYFIIKRFSNGQIFIIYISPQLKGLTL